MWIEFAPFISGFAAVFFWRREYLGCGIDIPHQLYSAMFPSTLKDRDWMDFLNAGRVAVFLILPQVRGGVSYGKMPSVAAAILLP